MPTAITAADITLNNSFVLEVNILHVVNEKKMNLFFKCYNLHFFSFWTTFNSETFLGQRFQALLSILFAVLCWITLLFATFWTMLICTVIKPNPKRRLFHNIMKTMIEEMLEQYFGSSTGLDKFGCFNNTFFQNSKLIFPSETIYS